MARCAYLVGLAGLALVLGAPRVLPNRRAAIRGRFGFAIDGVCHRIGTAGSSRSRTVVKAKRGFAWAASGYRTWGCFCITAMHDGVGRLVARKLGQAARACLSGNGGIPGAQNL